MAEMTAMQAAIWAGRQMEGPLGGVSAHLYVEFDGTGLDMARLARALDRVFARHPMLGLRVDADGRLCPGSGKARLECTDLRDCAPDQVAQALRGIRHDWTHQRLDLQAGKAARFSVSLLPRGAFRLHVDADMVAVDPSSLRIVIEDLALFHDHPTAELADPPAYVEWAERMVRDRTRQARRAVDRDWWRARLDSIAPAPSLPGPVMPDPAARVETRRLTKVIAPSDRQALQRVARAHRLTMSGLATTLFAATLARMTGQPRFRLNVPCFWRAPLVQDVDRIVGEFSDILLLDVDIAPQDSLADLAHRLAGRMAALFSHQTYQGVEVMRDLSRHHGQTQTAPVVFTSALDLPGGELFSDRVRRVFGQMVFSVSQGPHVALDAQLVAHEGGLLVNWDIRQDALPRDWVQGLFADFTDLLARVAHDPAVMDQPGRAAPVVAESLGALQQAYLLGRGDTVALGGVAMQEFREYRGTLCPQDLRDRLAGLIADIPALRTVIDVDRLTQRIDPVGRVNLQEVDLRDMTLAAALARIDDQREGYAHRIFPSGMSPWDVTLFLLPDGADHVVAFLRVDALIMDGRSIAAFAEALFGGADLPPAAPVITAPGDRRADAAYWAGRLAQVDAPVRLPWRVAPEQITRTRFARQQLCLPKALFGALRKRGAARGLFVNTTLTALALEVLAHWVEDGQICAGIPIAPESGAGFANKSSFIAALWSSSPGDLATRAAALQADIFEGLQHLAFSGVDIARHLYERHGTAPVLPVVVTNCLSWPAAGQGMRLHGGLTQTPQIAMDIRFSRNAAGDLLIDVDYATQAIAPQMVRDYLAALDRAAQQIASGDDFALCNVGIGHQPGPASPPHEGRFLEQIARNLTGDAADRTAIIMAGERVSYGDLGQQVRRHMAALRGRGLRPGSVVAICLPRGIAHTALVLACAFSGIVWAPIDASSPPERLAYLLANCHPDLVVGADGIAPQDLVAAPAALPLDELAQLSHSDRPAYMLYTSGTTGQPKCVVLSNRATANVIGCTQDHWQVTRDDVFASVTPLHHDMSVYDVLGSLAAGATLVLVPPDADKDAITWARLVAQHGVTIWCSVPSILEMLLACATDGQLDSLRLVAQGGDYIKPAAIAALRHALPEARLVSLGGPTETTIWSIWHDIEDSDLAQPPDHGDAPVPYGRAIAGNQYLLLDDAGRIVPVGVRGRMHVAGVNLALGYLENGEVAQSDFTTVTLPDGRVLRAFRTGDCGRYRPDGSIMFAGRVNGYVKIRGVRVSLPDVENVIVGHDAVARAIVVDFAGQAGAELGVLYVAGDARCVDVADLRRHAQARLPASHVPSRFVAVDALPLARTGKPDRKAARAALAGQGAVVPDQVQRVGRIYADILQPGAETPIAPDADLVAAGLRQRHLRALGAALKADFGFDPGPAALMRCRDVSQVVQMLQDDAKAIA